MKLRGVRRLWRAVTAVALVAAVAAGATYATASRGAATAATTTIDACVKHGGDVRIVSGPADCKASERAIAWNVVGPAGPIGPAGAPGKDGLSVHASSLAAGNTDCPFGGSKFVVGDAAPTFACNGAPGKDGKDGAPGKDGAALSSIDGLAGVSCTNAGTAGTINVTYGAGGAVTLTCVATSSGSGGDTGGGTGSTPPDCGTLPDYPNGQSYCSSDGTIGYTCNYGWTDADGDRANGCEQQLDLMNDPHNCGQPGHDVSSLPNAIGGCRNGVSVVAECDPGWTDLDMNPANGCEVASQCVHMSGYGGYADCNDPLGTPGDETTYNRQMAMDAAEAFAHNVGTPTYLTCDGADAFSSSYDGETAVWVYTGPLAGYVARVSNVTPACPTASSTTWN